jgi:uncharacterized protein
MLRFKVVDIGPEGLEIDTDIPAEIIDSVKEKFIKFTQPFHLVAILHKTGDKVIVTGSMSSIYRGECGRCLDAVEGKWDKEFTFAVETDRTTEFIDITEPLREEVLLYLPEKIVCSDECKGLCPVCGENLNKKECGCDRSDFQNHIEDKNETYQPFKNLRLKQ